MKKGQITAFIILGLIIVFLVAAFLLVRPSGTDEAKVEESVATTADGLAVSQFVKGCLDTRTKSGVLLSGLQGGYTDVPPNFISLSYSDVPYYYDNGTVSVVQLSDIETQLERFVNANMDPCINDFKEFTDRGIQVSAVQPPLADVTINPITGMGIALDYEVNIGSDESQETLKTFGMAYNFRIGIVREVAQKIIDKVSEDPKIIPISYLTELGDEYNVKIDSISYGDNKIVYIIEDLQNQVEGDTPLLFLFATRINLENNPPVIVLEDDKFTGNVGEEFVLVVGATDEENDPLEFNVQSEVAGIDPLTGRLAFTPEQAGTYNMQISVSDDSSKVEKNITVTIQ